jgi:hypothetical protein
VLGFVGAVIGVPVGLVLLAWAVDSLPHAPVEAGTSIPNRPGAPGELSVYFFGRPGIAKTSTDHDALRREAALWVGVPTLAGLLIAAAAGGYVGWRVGSRLGRSRRAVEPHIDPAADYDDKTAPGAAPDRHSPTG